MKISRYSWTPDFTSKHRPSHLPQGRPIYTVNKKPYGLLHSQRIFALFAIYLTCMHAGGSCPGRYSHVARTPSRFGCQPHPRYHFAIRQSACLNLVLSSLSARLLISLYHLTIIVPKPLSGKMQLGHLIDLLDCRYLLFSICSTLVLSGLYRDGFYSSIKLSGRIFRF